MKISSNHCLSQTIRARELNFGREHSPPHHVLHVTCHPSCVTNKFVLSFFSSSSEKVAELVGGVSVINGAYREILVEMVIRVTSGHWIFRIKMCMVLEYLKRNVLTLWHGFGIRQCPSLNLQKCVMSLSPRLWGFA